MVRASKHCPPCSGAVELCSQLRVPRHLLEQSSPHDARLPHSHWLDAMGQFAPSLLVVARPVHNRLDGREPFCEVTGGSLWRGAADVSGRLLDIAATNYRVSGERLAPEK